MKSSFPLNFIWPEMLWLLVAVPLLVLAYLWLLSRRKKTALRYANLALVKQAMGKSAGWKRHVPPALMLVAIAVLLVAVIRETDVPPEDQADQPPHDAGLAATKLAMQYPNVLFRGL